MSTLKAKNILYLIARTCLLQIYRFVICAIFSNYTEEIFLNSKKAFWSSTDGDMLLYASFNDTAVASLEFPWVEEGLRQHDPVKVPTTRSVHYPMVSAKDTTVD